MQDNPHIPQRWCQSSQTLQLKRKSCTAFQKSLRSSPSLHFRMDGKWPFPRQKSLSSVPSGTTPQWMYQRAAFQQDSRMTPFHGQPQTIKYMKPCLHRRLDGAHHSSSASPGPSISQVTSTERHTHLDSTAPHPSKHLTKLDLTKVSWFSSWLKFFFTAFMKWVITILFATN